MRGSTYFAQNVGALAMQTWTVPLLHKYHRINSIQNHWQPPLHRQPMNNCLKRNGKQSTVTAQSLGKSTSGKSPNPTRPSLGHLTLPNSSSLTRPNKALLNQFQAISDLGQIILSDEPKCTSPISLGPIRESIASTSQKPTHNSLLLPLPDPIA